MFTRISIGFLLLLLITAPLSAQDAAFPVYCGTLPEADCTLLQNAYANLFNLHSGSVELRIWAVNGTTKDEVFSAVISGAFTDFDATALLPSMSLQMFRTLRLDAMMATSFSMLDVPQATLPDAQMVVQPDIPFRAETRIRIIDGMLYVDLDAYQDVTGAESGGWGAYPLNVSPNESSGAIQLEALVTGLDAGNLIGAFEPAFVHRFLTVTRTDDGEGNAVFETYVDIPGLYAQPVFRQLMRERLEAQRTMLDMPSGAVTDNQLDNLAQRMGEAYPEPLLLHTQSVDLETGFLSGLSSWMLDESAMMIESAANNNDITSWSQSLVNFSLALDDFNQPVEITVPENATALDYETITRLPVSGLLPISRPDR